MTTVLRIILVFASLITFSYIILNIRKAKVRLDAVFFWILFGIFLILLSIFPNILNVAASLVGFYAPINFLFVSMIFLLLYKVFTLTMKISALQQKVEELVQKIALKEYDEQKNIENGKKLEISEKENILNV